MKEYNEPNHTVNVPRDQQSLKTMMHGKYNYQARGICPLK